MLEIIPVAPPLIWAYFCRSLSHVSKSVSIHTFIMHYPPLPTIKSCLDAKGQRHIVRCRCMPDAPANHAASYDGRECMVLLFLCMVFSISSESPKLHYYKWSDYRNAYYFLQITSKWSSNLRALPASQSYPNLLSWITSTGGRVLMHMRFTVVRWNVIEKIFCWKK